VIDKRRDMGGEPYGGGWPRSRCWRCGCISGGLMRTDRWAVALVAVVVERRRARRYLYATAQGRRDSGSGRPAPYGGAANPARQAGRGRGGGGPPPLWYGADRDTQRAVRRALRTGHARDERVDALAWEAAQRDIRTGFWFPAIYAVVLVLLLGILIQRIRTRDDGWMTALAVTLAAAFLAAVAVFLIRFRRSHRYLRNASRGGP
jgi:hypothetical protein